MRVITEFMGGGFGAKFGAGNFGVLATHLSKKANAPVRLMLDRKDEHLSVGNRPDSVQRLRIGAKRDGTLTAIHLEAYGTAGDGHGRGLRWPRAEHVHVRRGRDRGVGRVHARRPGRRLPRARTSAGLLRVRAGDRRARGEVKLDPLALRDKIDTSNARREERRIGAERVGWSRRHAAGADAGPIKRGIGMAQAIWYRFVDMDSSVEVRITRDGSVELMSGVQDIGGGIRTALAQVVAEELGLRPQDVAVRIGDTAFPAGPASGGSVTTGSITPPTRNAAHKVKLQLLEQVAAALGLKPEQLSLRGGNVHVADAQGHSSPRLTFRQAASKLQTEQIAARADRSKDYSAVGGEGPGGGRITYGGVQFAEVVVDTETGVIKVERVVAVHDCGRPMNPLAVESQVNGGILQGISYALYEDRVLDRKTGRMVNANLEQYKITRRARDAVRSSPSSSRSTTAAARPTRAA